jgi:catalase
VTELKAASEKAGAMAQVVATKINGTLPADHIVSGGPSVIFDVVAIVTGDAGAQALAKMPSAVQWVADAFAHCKVMGVVAAAQPLLDKANVVPDEGVIELGKGVEGLFAKAKAGRIWAREEAAPTIKAPPARPAAKKR